MNNAPRSIRFRGRAGKALFIAVASVCLTAVVGYAAYRMLFDRPGEAAASLIPASADIVVTLDTKPSDRQASTFKLIADALEREGIAKRFDDLFKGLFDGSRIASHIRPHLSRDFAFGMWDPNSADPHFVVLCALSDEGAVREVLDTRGIRRSGGVYAIGGSQVPAFAKLVDGYLAVSNATTGLEHLEEVRTGREPPVTKVAEFVSARASLPDDANLMVFVSPRAMREMNEDASRETGASAFRGTEWLAISATIEQEGIAFDWHMPMKASSAKGLQALAGIPALSYESFESLPDGAFGVFALSQAGSYWDWVKETASADPSAREEMQSGIADFEKETGLNIDEDILPALGGQQLIAVYPGPPGGKEFVDGLVLVTDARGANPAALADKVRALVERKSAEEGAPVRFVESKIGDVTVWSLDAQTQKELVDSLSGVMVQPADLGKAPAPEVVMMRGDGAPHSSPANAPASSEPAPALKEKSVLYAQLGDAVLIASSRGILNRAISARQSGRSLAQDPAFSAMRAQAVAGAQSVMMVDLRRILEELRPMLEDSLSNGPIKAEDILGMFGESGGLVVSGRYDGDVALCRLLLPLNFENVVRVVGELIRMAEPHPMELPGQIAR
jgi:hypothetical protein